MRLAAHVHAVAIGPDVVLLDLRQDAYFCLPDLARALGPVLTDRAADLPAALVDVFRAGGWAADMPEGAPPDRPLREPRADLTVLSPRPLRGRDIGPLIGSLWDLAVRYHGRGLPQVLEFVRRAPSHLAAARTPAPELLDLIARFRSAEVWLPTPGKCLARSFLLLRFLQRSGQSADWVFGVRTWPFGAHCWLQVGDTALDEAVELAAEFKPILAA